MTDQPAHPTRENEKARADEKPVPAPVCVRERLPEYTRRESLWCDRCRGYSGWKREECPFKPDSYLDDLAGIPR